MKASLRAPRPALRVHAEAPWLAPVLRAAIATGKWAASAAPGPAPALGDATCPASVAPALGVVVRAAGARLQATLLDPEAGCRIATAAAPAGDAAPAQLVAKLVDALARAPDPRRTRPPPAPAEAAPRPPARPPPAALTAFAEAWVGTRFARGGDAKAGVDDAHLAARLYREVYGRDLGPTLKDQLASGPEVVLPKGRVEGALEPGDLLFMVTYAYLPRSVGVYLGSGQVLQAEVIRGVVVGKVPEDVPDFLYLVARRPLARP